MSLGEIIQLPRITDPRGNLTVAENNTQLPFVMQRVYWLYDVPAGEGRGGHAHKECLEFLVALSGSFSVTLTDGKLSVTYSLNHPYEGLLIEKGVWRTLDDFSSGSVCMVVASQVFDESDYIRDYDEYLKYIG